MFCGGSFRAVGCLESRLDTARACRRVCLFCSGTLAEPGRVRRQRPETRIGGAFFQAIAPVLAWPTEGIA